MNLNGTSIAYFSIEVPMNRSQSNKSENKPNPAPKFLQKIFSGAAADLTPDAIQRIKDREPKELDLETVEDRENSDPREQSFHSELEYDGYDSIEEYDNNAYRSNVEGTGSPTKELKFKGREASEVIEDVEESPVNPQKNQT